MVPVTGLEPVRAKRPWDFKSQVSTYSTTPADLNHQKVLLTFVIQIV